MAEATESMATGPAGPTGAPGGPTGTTLPTGPSAPTGPSESAPTGGRGPRADGKWVHEHTTRDDAELVTLHGKKITVTHEELAVMLQKAGGFRTRVAKQLGVTVSAISHRIRRSKYLQEVCKTVEETVVDLAEAALISAAQKGEPWAIKMILKCKGRKRGWIEKTDLVLGVDGEAPPPPFVLGLHDQAYVEREREKTKKALAEVVDAVLVEDIPAKKKRKPEPVYVEPWMSTDVWTDTMEHGATGADKAQGGPVAPVTAPNPPEGHAPASAAKPVERPAAPAQPPPKPPPPPRIPRTPSEARQMRLEREAAERRAKGLPPIGQQTSQAKHPATALPVTFPRR